VGPTRRNCRASADGGKAEEFESAAQQDVDQIGVGASGDTVELGGDLWRACLDRRPGSGGLSARGAIGGRPVLRACRRDHARNLRSELLSMLAAALEGRALQDQGGHHRLRPANISTVRIAATVIKM